MSDETNSLTSIFDPSRSINPQGYSHEEQLASSRELLQNESAKGDEVSIINSIELVNGRPSSWGLQIICDSASCRVWFPLKTEPKHRASVFTIHLGRSQSLSERDGYRAVPTFLEYLSSVFFPIGLRTASCVKSCCEKSEYIS